MAPLEEMQTAMVNRSIRTIKAELEYLCDSNIISPQTLNELLSSIPEQKALRAPLSVGAVPSAFAQPTPTPPRSGMSNLNLNNHSNNATNETNGYPSPPAYQQPHQQQAAPPPPSANWPPLCEATALYAYTSTDAGDLELQPNDHVAVTEYMNAEWWKGRSTRTGKEGIFPRSYVKVVEKSMPMNDRTPSQANNYGNVPLQVAEGQQQPVEGPSKFESGSKKFGKKLGNAAIFGAGASIGGNLVNAIL